MKAKSFLIAGLIGVVLAGCCTINIAPSANAVLRVTDVKAHWEAVGTSYDLVIIAKGTVPTSGYSSPWLDQVLTLNPSEDRYVNFQFLAVRPGTDAIVAPVVSELTVTNRWKGLPQDVRGVRVIGQQNQACVRAGNPPPKR